ncbi:phosphotransferase family protein [Mycobacterium kubicae]|uniref:phosphotransferase family protein n=1 Tax=Mycobacterium kubicae TaxID=120959 RepID=UPI0016407582|nr:phosphotransferase family protein [Mycobacterium kubicae]QNI08550.1 phosphotransferase family protein [Mycobacterium kubicae]
MTDLDPDQLCGRLSQLRITGLRPLTGGASSLTYIAQAAGQPVVVKVAPAGLPPTGHRDVLRQCRVIKALRPTAVPVPEVVWEDAGRPPEEPPLFVMSLVVGSSFEPLFDFDCAERDDVVADRFSNAAAVMAALHQIEPTAVGLGTEPVIDTYAEIQRWCKTLDTVDPTLVPGWRQVATALETSVPAPAPAAIVHGDFRLGNLLAVDDRISGVIDWEIWSVGDPRADVGWFLINSDPQTYRRATPYTGKTPHPDELAATYQGALGRSVPDLGWFQALACFKSAATWSLIVKHNRRRRRPDPDLEAMSEVLGHLLSRARLLLG